MDAYGLNASELPPELIAQLVGSQGQKAIAEAMLKQSMQPLQVDQPKGRFQGVVSPLEAIAKVMQGSVARGNINAADQQAAMVAKQSEEGRRQAMADYMATAKGTPGTAPLTPNDDEGNPMPSVGGIPGDRRQAIVNALSSPYLKNSKFLEWEQKDLNKDEERADQQRFLKEQKRQQMDQRQWEIQQQHAAKLEQIKALEAERRISREEADRRTADLRRELAMQSADLRRELAANRPDPNRPKLKPGERFDEATGKVVPIEGSDLYRGQADKHGKDLNALKAVETKTDSALKKIDEILGPDPNKPTPAEGFNNLFGGYTALATQYKPGATQDVRAKIESLKSDMKSAGLEMIRAGGSIGAMTEREWPIVQDMISRIDPKMGLPAAIQEFNKIRAYMGRIQSNARDTYRGEWGDSVFFGKGQPASGRSQVIKFDAQGNPVQ